MKLRYSSSAPVARLVQYIELLKQAQEDVSLAELAAHAEICLGGQQALAENRSGLDFFEIVTKLRTVLPESFKWQGLAIIFQELKTQSVEQLALGLADLMEGKSLSSIGYQLHKERKLGQGQDQAWNVVKLAGDTTGPVLRIPSNAVEHSSLKDQYFKALLAKRLEVIRQVQALQKEWLQNNQQQVFSECYIKLHPTYSCNWNCSHCSFSQADLKQQSNGTMDLEAIFGKAEQIQKQVEAENGKYELEIFVNEHPDALLALKAFLKRFEAEPSANVDVICDVKTASKHRLHQVLQGRLASLIISLDLQQPNIEKTPQYAVVKQCGRFNVIFDGRTTSTILRKTLTPLVEGGKAVFLILKEFGADWHEPTEELCQDLVELALLGGGAVQGKLINVIRNCVLSLPNIEPKHLQGCTSSHTYSIHPDGSVDKRCNFDLGDRQEYFQECGQCLHQDVCLPPCHGNAKDWLVHWCGLVERLKLQTQIWLAKRMSDPEWLERYHAKCDCAEQSTDIQDSSPSDETVTKSEEEQ